jgi:hypothetical protein
MTVAVNVAAVPCEMEVTALPPEVIASVVVVAGFTVKVAEATGLPTVVALMAKALMVVDRVTVRVTGLAALVELVVGKVPSVV